MDTLLYIYIYNYNSHVYIVIIIMVITIIIYNDIYPFAGSPPVDPVVTSDTVVALMYDSYITLLKRLKSFETGAPI